MLQQLDLIFKFMCNAKLYRAGNLFRYQFAIFFARIQISGCLRIFDMNSHPVCMSSSKINYYLSMQKNHIHIAVALLKTCLLKMILILITYYDWLVSFSWIKAVLVLKTWVDFIEIHKIWWTSETCCCKFHESQQNKLKVLKLR